MGDAHKCVCTAYRARRTHALSRICVLPAPQEWRRWARGVCTRPYGGGLLLVRAGPAWVPYVSVCLHRQLEQWLDPGATFESQDDVSAWAWHPAAEDAISYSHLDIASWPGPICDVCYASTCAFCGYVFADVGEAFPSRTTRRRLACVGCAEWGAPAPMFGPDWEALTAAPPPSEGGAGAP